MREDIKENVIRLMGRKQFDEKIRRNERKKENNQTLNLTGAFSENNPKVIFRSFGDIRMVVVPFEERTEEYDEIRKAVRRLPQYEEKSWQYGSLAHKNKGAVIYNFNSAGTGYSVAAERNFSDRYGRQICGSEKFMNYKASGGDEFNRGFENTDLYGNRGYFGGNEQEDFNHAMRTTAGILPPRLFAAEHIAEMDMLTCGDYFSDRNIFNSIKKFNELQIPDNGYRLTHTGWKGGAVAAFYPGVLRRIGALLKQDFYIAFPSPDEARIHPAANTDVRQIGKAIRRSNRAMELKKPCDIVTDKVYRYCRNLKMLREVEFPEW